MLHKERPDLDLAWADIFVDDKLQSFVRDGRITRSELIQSIVEFTTANPHSYLQPSQIFHSYLTSSCANADFTRDFANAISNLVELEVLTENKPEVTQKKIIYYTILAIQKNPDKVERFLPH